MTEVHQESANTEKCSIDELIFERRWRRMLGIFEGSQISGGGALYWNGAWFGFPVNNFAERYINFMQISLKKHTVAQYRN
jgi:hypothetical protein